MIFSTSYFQYAYKEAKSIAYYFNVNCDIAKQFYQSYFFEEIARRDWNLQRLQIRIKSSASHGLWKERHLIRKRLQRITLVYRTLPNVSAFLQTVISTLINSVQVFCSHLILKW